MINHYPESSCKISRSKNTLFISGELRVSNMRLFWLELSGLAKRFPEEATLDFSKCTLAFASSILAACAWVIDLQRAGTKFNLRLPADPRLSNLFLNTNWAHFISPASFPESRITSATRVPAARYSSSTELSVIHEKIMSSILSAFKIERGSLKVVEWAINEVADNVLNHARSKIGGLIQGSLYQKSSSIQIDVMDPGVGIPTTIREVNPWLRSDALALKLSIEEGVTRNKRTNAGNGLYGTFRAAVLSKGLFSINSGRGVLFAQAEKARHFDEQSMFPGTLISMRLNFHGLNLKDVLVFKGRTHEPLFDFYEKNYESGDGKILFVLKNEYASFNSRESGRAVRTKLINIISGVNPSKINIDFEGVSIITSSFADEVFGRLFVELGAMRFMKLFEFSNADETLLGLIDRGIKQRIKLEDNK